MQGGRGEGTLAGISVSQALLGRWDESSQAVDEALEMVCPQYRMFTCSVLIGLSQQNPSHPISLANCIALALHTGKPIAFADGILT
jgi:hypothetical protein